MTVAFESGYTLPGSDMPLKHARIAHASNWLTAGTVTASSTATGYFADAPDNSLTYEVWKPSALLATWELAWGAAQTADYCAIAGHNFGTNGNTVTVQYDVAGTGTWVTAVTVAPADDSPLFCIFEPVAAKKWRISISGGTAPEVAVVRFGVALQMYRPFYGGFSPVFMNRQSIVRSNASERGQWLGRTTIRTDISGQYSWSNLPEAWVRANIYPLIKALESDPMFIAWRPGENNDVDYAWTTEAVAAPSLAGVRDLMTFSISARGAGYE